MKKEGAIKRPLKKSGINTFPLQAYYTTKRRYKT